MQLKRFHTNRTESGQAGATAVGAVAVIVLVVGVIWFIMFVAGWKSVPVDKVALHYTGGPVEGQKFQKVVPPGTGAKFYGLLDKVVLLPANQRNYIVSKQVDEGDRKGADSIKVPAKQGVEIEFEVSVYFKLNTGETVARRFYEQICTKYNCGTDDGWDDMLNDNFRKIIETSMRQKVFSYTVDELYANAVGEASGNSDAIQKIQTEIAGALKDNVNSTLGGRFFCGPQFDRNKPEVCPDFQFIINSAEPTSQDIRNSFSNQRVSQNNIQVATNEAEASRQRALGLKASQEASQISLTPEYLRLREIEAQLACASNPNCTMVVSNGGTNVNVQPR